MRYPRSPACLCCQLTILAEWPDGGPPAIIECGFCRRRWLVGAVIPLDTLVEPVTALALTPLPDD